MARILGILSIGKKFKHRKNLREENKSQQKKSLKVIKIKELYILMRAIKVAV